MASFQSLDATVHKNITSTHSYTQFLLSQINPICTMNFFLGTLYGGWILTVVRALQPYGYSPTTTTLRLQPHHYYPTATALPLLPYGYSPTTTTLRLQPYHYSHTTAVLLHLCQPERVARSHSASLSILSGLLKAT